MGTSLVPSRGVCLCAPRGPLASPPPGSLLQSPLAFPSGPERSRPPKRRRSVHAERAPVRGHYYEGRAGPFCGSGAKAVSGPGERRAERPCASGSPTQLFTRRRCREGARGASGRSAGGERPSVSAEGRGGGGDGGGRLCSPPSGLGLGRGSRLKTVAEDDAAGKEAEAAQVRFLSWYECRWVSPARGGRPKPCGRPGDAPGRSSPLGPWPPGALGPERTRVRLAPLW